MINIKRLSIKNIIKAFALIALFLWLSHPLVHPHHSENHQTCPCCQTFNSSDVPDTITETLITPFSILFYCIILLTTFYQKLLIKISPSRDPPYIFDYASTT